ncbi:MAG TPA: hypothetical protein VJ732_13125, partial [Bryobacteraceae bacterium]|nr:hypothetical protein [Bryobacteraceae bacterium]
MFLFDFFRSFLPLHNPLGFGAADFVEFALTALLLLAAVLGPRWMEPYGSRLARKTQWCMLLLAGLPAGLRLALLAHHPVPVPEVYDEFGHLLVADTLRHLRLANPAHPLAQFFETQFVLQQPTYSSIYPIGNGIALALGWVLFGLPWAGVLMAAAAFCALCYWMLRAWTTPGWALLGGMLAVLEFGPLSAWMNDYWGGAVAAVAGCLVFGALPRILSRARPRDAALLGAGLGLHLLTRPYESIFLFLSVLLFFLPAVRKPGELRLLARLLPATLAVLLPAAGITLLHNKQVTGSWTTLPYALSQSQYGVPTSLTFQANPAPHRALNREQALNYRMQTSFRPTGGETVKTFLQRLEYRVRYYRFFFLAPLYLAVPWFFQALRQYRFLWVVLTVAVFVLGANFYPFFEVHYIAAVTSLFVLASVVGLEHLARFSGGAARIIVFLCAAQFVFWYGMHAFEEFPAAAAMLRYETWNGIDHPD